MTMDTTTAEMPVTKRNGMSSSYSRAQDYRIADDAEVTILMWKGPTVRVNRADPRGGMTEADVGEILLELPKVLED